MFLQLSHSVKGFLRFWRLEIKSRVTSDPQPVVVYIMIISIRSNALRNDFISASLFIEM